MHQQNRYPLHRILARITDYVETQSGPASRYLDYVSEGKNRYEVEHIWADHPERHTDEFGHPADFAEHRNRIGGLLLLPKSFNASYGDLHLRGEAAALQHAEPARPLAAPAVLRAQPRLPPLHRASGLPFKPMAEFKKADLEDRSELYRQIAERIWNPADLLKGHSHDRRPQAVCGIQGVGAALAWAVPKHWSVLPNRALFTEVKDRKHPDEEMLSVTITKRNRHGRKPADDSSKKDSSLMQRLTSCSAARHCLQQNAGVAGCIGASDFAESSVPHMSSCGCAARMTLPCYFHHLYRTPQFAKEAERWSYGITSTCGASVQSTSR